MAPLISHKGDGRHLTEVVLPIAMFSTIATAYAASSFHMLLIFSLASTGISRRTGRAYPSRVEARWGKRGSYARVFSMHAR